MKRSLLSISFGCTILALMGSEPVRPIVSGDLRDFGFSRPDTVINLDCGEAVTDNLNPLFFADYRDGFELLFTVKFNTFLTEQAVVCKESTHGSTTGSLTVGYDPGSEQIFAEVMQSNGVPCRIEAGPKVIDSRRYDVRVKSSIYSLPKREDDSITSLLELNVYPSEHPSDSILAENNNQLLYMGDALPYVPGRWIIGHGYPGGFPNSLQLRNGEVGNLRIKGIGRVHVPGSNPLFTDRFTGDPAGLVTNGRMYLYVGEDCAAPGVQPEQLAYSMAPSMEGPWKYGGLLTGPARYGFTIHPSVNEYKGKWYLFYHDGCYPHEGTPGGDCRRHVCAEELHFNSNGTIVPVKLTHEGITKQKFIPVASDIK